MTTPSPRTTHPMAGTGGARVETGIFDTVAESIFGQPDPNTWRPLSISTFLSEGWHEAWVPSPNGSGGAPRQGWINAMDGNIYRLGSSRSLRGSTKARRATPTSVPTRSTRR